MTKLDQEMQAKKEEGMKNFQTPEGKTLALRHVANTSLYRVVFEGGGEMPESLKGMFTGIKEANEAIRKYLEKRWKVATGEIKTHRDRSKKKNVTRDVDKKSEEEAVNG